MKTNIQFSKSSFEASPFRCAKAIEFGWCLYDPFHRKATYLNRGEPDHFVESRGHGWLDKPSDSLNPKRFIFHEFVGDDANVPSKSGKIFFLAQMVFYNDGHVQANTWTGFLTLPKTYDRILDGIIPLMLRNPPFFFDKHISIIYRVSGKNKCLYMYITVYIYRVISMGPLSNQSKKHIPFIDGPRWTSWPSLQAWISQVANRTKNARQRYGNSVDRNKSPTTTVWM